MSRKAQTVMDKFKALCLEATDTELLGMYAGLGFAVSICSRGEKPATEPQARKGKGIPANRLAVEPQASEEAR